MNIHHLHNWNVSAKEAVEIQKELACRCIFTHRNLKIALIAGADISYDKARNMLYAAVIVLSYPALELVEMQYTISVPNFPYIPGLLSFREVPPLLGCFERLHTAPDVVLCDGQGYAHPRRLGLASHLGIILNIPTIGCAKSRLIGEETEPHKERGSITPLIDKGEIIGQVVRTKMNVKSVYVSPGHLLSLDNAVNIVLSCCTKYRIPEPIRRAHTEVNKLRVNAK